MRKFKLTINSNNPEKILKIANLVVLKKLTDNASYNEYICTFKSDYRKRKKIIKREHGTKEVKRNLKVKEVKRKRKIRSRF